MRWGAWGNSVIELLDVVEEPEPQLDIDSFVSSGKEKLSEKIPAFEPWDKSETEEEPEQKEWIQPVVKGEGIAGKEAPPFEKKTPLKETLSKVELFEKIELPGDSG